MTLGTLDFYREMATRLNGDATWQELAKEITYSMLHVYTGPIDKAFAFRFDQGRISDVREVDVQGASADFVLTATPDNWKKVFSKLPKARASFMHYGLSTGAVRFTGPFMKTYLSQVKPWEHLIDVMSLAKGD